jgi:hypothetical protein
MYLNKKNYLVRRLYASTIKNFAEADPNKALIPVSIDNEGLITVLYDNEEHEVHLHNVDKIDY